MKGLELELRATTITPEKYQFIVSIKQTNKKQRGKQANKQINARKVLSQRLKKGCKILKKKKTYKNIKGSGQDFFVYNYLQSTPVNLLA